MSGAGTYNRRVQIQRNAADPEADGDAVGEVAPDFATIGRRWASVQPLSGREYFAAQQAVSDVTHTVKLRADSLTKTITPSDRLLFGDRVLGILVTRNLGEAGVEIELACVERIKEAPEG
ncbi:MAG TPA: phage head closure protein [Pirellulales bacterium]